MKHNSEKNHRVVHTLAGALVVALVSGGAVEYSRVQKGNELPNIAQLTRDGPYQIVIAEPTGEPFDNPTDIAEQFGESPTSELAASLIEQEGPGGKTYPGEEFVVPERLTNPSDYAKVQEKLRPQQKLDQ